VEVKGLDNAIKQQLESDSLSSLPLALYILAISGFHLRIDLDNAIK
jgi:hypothetical protein